MEISHQSKFDRYHIRWKKRRGGGGYLKIDVLPRLSGVPPSPSFAHEVAVTVELWQFFPTQHEPPYADVTPSAHSLPMQ
jgi:hypothetical protein